MARLTSRQAQLVALQSSVLDLWGRCSSDPAFAAAFGTPSAPSITGGSGSVAGGVASSVADGAPSLAGAAGNLADGVDGAGEAGDPIQMLNMVQEFVMAKSAPLSMQHFSEIQRAATRVWQRHFKHRGELRGRVVATFDALSHTAGVLAHKMRGVDDKAGRSRDGERELARQLRQMAQQKRALEGALARRDEMVRQLLGVPRKERPASAGAEALRILQADADAGAASSWRQQQQQQQYTGGSGSPLPYGSPLASGTAAAVARPQRPGSAVQSASYRAGHQAPYAGGGGGPGPAHSSRAAAPQRPGSAPARRTAGKATTQSGAAAAMMGGTLAYVLSPGVTALVPDMVADSPAGAHWQAYAAGASLQQRPVTPAGSLFHVASAAADEGAGSAAAQQQQHLGRGSSSPTAAGPDAPYSKGASHTHRREEPGTGDSSSGGWQASTGGPAAAGQPRPASVRWAAPQRSSIEAAFLSRLERQAVG